MPENETEITPEGACKLAKASAETIRRWCRRGLLIHRVTRVGRIWVNRADLVRFLSSEETTENQR